jgi:hypothetical protein
VNLAKYLDEKKLGEIADQAFEEYEIDEKSREEWLEDQATWIKLYHDQLKPKDPPWDGASDDHIPMLAEGCVQFHARAYRNFFASNTFVDCVPTGSIRPEDRDRAGRVGKYMSWLLSIKDKNYKRRKDRMLRALPLHGSYFTKTYRDNLNRKIVVENVSPLKLVANYTSDGLDIEELERKTQIIDIPRRKARFLASKAAQAYFIEEPEEYILSEENEAREALAEASGEKKALETSGNSPARVLEQHRWLDLDGDGVDEPYIVWIDYMSRKVLRVSIRWSWDSWVRSQFKQPLEYFTHYAYLENPDGFYGHGQGHLVGSTNISVDKLLRQVINAGTIQNARPGFASQQAGIRSGVIDVQLGKITKLNASGPIKDLLMFLEHPGPSESQFKVLQLLMMRGDRLNMVTDMLTGQSEKVWQTGATNSLIEQGLMTFSAVQTRLHAALEQELSKIARLLRIYLDDEEYFAFNDGENDGDYVVYRQDFDDDLQVTPAFDPKQLTKQERLKTAETEYKVIMSNPMLAQQPRYNINATRRFLEELGVTDIDEVTPNPDAQQAPQQPGQQQDPKVALMARQQDMQMQVMESQAAGDKAKVQLDAKKAAADDEHRKADRALKEKELQLKAMKTQHDMQMAERKEENAQQREMMQAQQAAMNPQLGPQGVPQ